MIAEIDDAAIEALVRRFYAKVRLDPEIGPVFDDAVEDWEAHFAILTSFWSSVMLRSGQYKGNPMAVHMGQPIQPPMFDRWLALWGQTAGELFEPDVADRFRATAARIGESLKLALFFRPDTSSPLPRGEAG